MATTRIATRQGAAAQSRATGARAARSQAVSAPRLRPARRSARTVQRGPRGVAAPTATPSPELQERLVGQLSRPLAPASTDAVVRDATPRTASVSARPTRMAAPQRNSQISTGQVRLTERGLLLVLMCFAVLAATAVTVLAVGFFSVSNAPLPDRSAADSVAAAGSVMHHG